jgi:uncharacterized protein
MTPVMKTPGVYIVEKNAFPNSVVEVATAVPAFVGYTQIHEEQGRSLKDRPRLVTSMAEFHTFFGFGPEVEYTLATTKPTVAAADPVPAGPEDPVAKVGATSYYLTRNSERFHLYYSMLLFYQNGGGRCYIVSVGDYSAAPDGARIMEGIEALKKEQEPTMVVIPDAVLLDAANCGSVQSAALMHCGDDRIRSRVAILDIHKGYLPRATPDPVKDFRDGPIGVNNLDFGAAYYPWVETTIVQESVLGYTNLDAAGRTALKEILEAEGRIHADLLEPLDLRTEAEAARKAASAATVAKEKADKAAAAAKAAPEDAAKKTAAAEAAKAAQEAAEAAQDAAAAADPSRVAASAARVAREKADQAAAAAKAAPEDTAKQTAATRAAAAAEEARKAATRVEEDAMVLNKALVAQSPWFKSLIKKIQADLNLLPPSGAMAGIYTMVDNTRGVWKAPANVSLNSVIKPSVNISHEEQEDLNVSPQGKSVNAIRTFVGEGTLVWGARTLDGNSLDWRYISVRRTMIMLEQSIKLAAKAYVFEANDSGTWVTLKSMIGNFLTGIWKRGGLAGTSPTDAFSVHVGLGETMTSEDILEGILRVTVLVAMTRPAEFIEITFQQQMQKS